MLSGDVTAAVVLAVIIILVMLCIWPGYARVTPESVRGYWASQDGKMYAIRPQETCDGSNRAFRILGNPRSRDNSAHNVSEGPNYYGSTVGLRGVKLYLSEMRGASSLHGTVSLGGRHINWADGGVWTRQGL